MAISKTSHGVYALCTDAQRNKIKLTAFTLELQFLSVNGRKLGKEVDICQSLSRYLQAVGGENRTDFQ